MKSRFYAVLVIICLFSGAEAGAQTWVPHSPDTTLWGCYNLKQYFRQGTEVYTFTDQTWYRCFHFGAPWEERDQSGITSGAQLYGSAFVVNDTFFTITQFGEWYYSSDSVNTWQAFTPTGFPPVAQFSTIYFYRLGDKVLAEYGSGKYYTFNGLDWFNVPVSMDYFSVLSDTILRGRIPATGDYVVYDADFNPVDTLYNAMPGGGSNVYGNYAYSFSTSNDSVYRTDLLVQNPVPVAIGGFPNDTLLDVCFPITYAATGNFHLIQGRYTSSTGRETVVIYASGDGGVTWSARPDLKWMGYDWPAALTSDSLIAYDYFRANYRYSVDGGITWDPFYNKVYGLSYYKIPFSITGDTLMWYKTPPIGGYFYAHGIYRSLDGGISWEPASNGLPLLESFSDSTIQCYSRAIGPYRYSSTYMVWLEDAYKMYYTTDAGSNWQQSFAPAPWADAVVYSGRDDDEIFFDAWDADINVHFFYRTSDGGLTWSPISVPRGDSAAPGQRYSNLMIQGHNDTLLCRFEQRDNAVYGPSNFVHRLFLSTDDGATWTEITPPVIAGNPARMLDMGDYLANQEIRLAYGARADQFIMLVRIVDSVSEDPRYLPLVHEDSLLWFDGANWTIVPHTGLPSDIDIHSLMFDGSDYFLGSNYGVYTSSDSGYTWTTNGLRLAGPNAVQSNNGFTGRLKLYGLTKFTTTILTTTDGNGIWRLDVNPLTTEPAATTGNGISVYPVPVVDESYSWNYNADAGDLTYELINSAGQTVRSVSYSNYVSGTLMTESTTGLASGIYMIRITTELGAEVQKIVVE